MQVAGDKRTEVESIKQLPPQLSLEPSSSQSFSLYLPESRKYLCAPALPGLSEIKVN